jgi:N-methylhydantoinase A/oxoprolinase/acetone carboxylase beta subunit
VPEGPLDTDALTVARGNFDATHRRIWGYALEHFDVNVTMARITATIVLPKPAAPGLPGQEPTLDPASAPRTEVFLDGQWQSVPVLPRDHLCPGQTVPGPALITTPTATVVLHDADRAHVEPSGHLWIR